VTGTSILCNSHRFILKETNIFTTTLISEIYSIIEKIVVSRRRKKTSAVVVRNKENRLRRNLGAENGI